MNFCFTLSFHSTSVFASTGAILTAWSVGLAPARTRTGGSHSFKRLAGMDCVWHETYFMRGGMEAIYGDVPPPLGLMGFAPIQPATGSTAFTARSRLKVAGEQTVDVPISETQIPKRDIPS